MYLQLEVIKDCKDGYEGGSMKQIRYILRTAMLKIVNIRVFILFLILLALTVKFNRPYVLFVREKAYPINWCIFPFIADSPFFLTIFYFGIIYINSDVPFMQHENMYQVIRLGRRKWAAGQLFGIFLRSLSIVLVTAVIPLASFIGKIAWTNDWGKVIYTLASYRRSGEFLNDIMIDYRFMYEILGEFTPIRLMGLMVIMSTLICTFLGMLMFLISLYAGKLMAVATAGALSVMIYVVQNVGGSVRRVLAHFVPTYWAELALLKTKDTGSGYYRLPSVPYMLVFLSVGIAVMSVFIFWRAKNMEFNWENEDA